VITQFEKNMDESLLINLVNEYSQKIIDETNLLKNCQEHPMKTIIDLIENSANDENLQKMSLHWDPWF
jgi:hypothetical protein